MMGDPALSALTSSDGVRGVSEGSGGFIENFKVNVNVSFQVSEIPLCLTSLVSPRILNLLNLCHQRAIRVRSHSFETLGVPRKIGGTASQKSKVKNYNKTKGGA